MRNWLLETGFECEILARSGVAWMADGMCKGSVSHTRTSTCFRFWGSGIGVRGMDSGLQV